MKRNELNEVKKMDEKALDGRVNQVRAKLIDLHLGQNNNKIASTKEKRALKVELAQVLTIKRQQQLIAELAKGVEDAK